MLPSDRERVEERVERRVERQDEHGGPGVDIGRDLHGAAGRQQSHDNNGHPADEIRSHYQGHTDCQFDLQIEPTPAAINEGVRINFLQLMSLKDLEGRDGCKCVLTCVDL